MWSNLHKYSMAFKCSAVFKPTTEAQYTNVMFSLYSDLVALIYDSKLHCILKQSVYSSLRDLQMNYNLSAVQQ